VKSGGGILRRTPTHRRRRKHPVPPHKNESTGYSSCGSEPLEGTVSLTRSIVLPRDPRHLEDPLRKKRFLLPAELELLNPYSLTFRTMATTKASVTPPLDLARLGRLRVATF
jgi:hypothetical protein